MAVVPPKQWPPLEPEKGGKPMLDLPEYPGLPTVGGKTTVVIVPKRPRKQKDPKPPDDTAQKPPFSSDPATP